MKSVFVITTPELKNTGRHSFAFMIAVPRENPLYDKLPSYWGTWGHVFLTPKGDDHFNPWAWAAMQRGEEHGQIVGDDGTPRCNLAIWNSGKSDPLLAAGWNYSEDGETWPLTLESFPERCALLMPRDLFACFEAACKLKDVEVVVYHHNEPIATAS